MTTKPLKKKGIRAVAPTRAAAIPKPAQSSSPPEIAKTGPRGGKPKPREDRAISLTLKVSSGQHRLLTEARLDENVTLQELLLRAVALYFEREHGKKFLTP